ncbi:hypothetical protein JF550_03930 [Microbacterium esteraromaticum]|uniref:Uncharacterized protein n=1 Tax=Microbacterium esteraromaticum TaxID=57043 RepID=A0A939DTW7_9MICO|nr:hypothetical protein [Microbacterium esteraromaticum]MBN8205106.1 hypothetical protein [Microbacterium esteraromaticum]MBN8415260.1 hypothetical protein [Microbacterium esteraromaticum]
MGLVPVLCRWRRRNHPAPTDLEHEREASPAACWTSPAADFEHSTPPRWTPTAADLPDDDTEEWLQRVAGVSAELADRSADIHALLTTHAQTVADPRPKLAMLAKWQPVSPSALRHRYNDHHVQAVRELLKADPLVDIFLAPFLSVIDRDFSGISPALDEQLKRRRRMRSIVSEEFTALFGKNASKQLGFVRNPADERITRPIDDLASFMSVALKRRDPKLLSVFD